MTLRFVGGFVLLFSRCISAPKRARRWRHASSMAAPGGDGLCTLEPSPASIVDRSQSIEHGTGNPSEMGPAGGRGHEGCPPPPSLWQACGSLSRPLGRRGGGGRGRRSGKALRGRTGPFGGRQLHARACPIRLSSVGSRHHTLGGAVRRAAPPGRGSGREAPGRARVRTAPPGPDVTVRSAGC